MEGIANIIKIKDSTLDDISGPMSAVRVLAESRYEKFVAGCQEAMERDSYDTEDKHVIRDLRKESEAQTDALEEELMLLEAKYRTEGKKKPLTDLLAIYPMLVERRKQTAVQVKDVFAVVEAMRNKEEEDTEKELKAKREVDNLQRAGHPSLDRGGGRRPDDGSQFKEPSG